MGQDMPRLSIDISSEEHRQLKAIAALNGQSIKDYVVARTLHGDDKSDDTADEALSGLKTLLEDRLTEVEAGKVKTVTAAQIGQMARARLSRQ
jgi:Antitoxin ParD